MRIALLGYGKMGKEIEKIALARQHEIGLIIDIDNYNELTRENLQATDVAIDFSVPSGAYTNIMKCFDADIPIVSGTTGWLDKFDEVIDICRKKNKSFFYASNYSIGVNIFFHLNRQLAELMNKFPDYDVDIEEIHHIHKLDAPSGTAISLANDILKQIERKKEWKLDFQGDKDIISISAKREGEIPGIHIINYNSQVDTIEIKHTAKSRKGLAFGAVLAAEYVLDKKGYHTMNDLLKLDELNG
jgi:4-hydroxy-tetrahydrodipicolinate reductase